MIRVICCALLLACCVQVKAQQSVLDSLLALPQKLTADPNANCNKRINTYKTRFAGITIEQLDSALNAVRKVNAELISPTVKNCPAALVVDHLDSMLKAQMNKGFPDSLKILNALAAVKYHFAGLVRIQVDFSDSLIKSKKPVVAVSSFEPFIITPSVDSVPFEVFVSADERYVLTANLPGYEPDTMEIRCTKDTVVMLASLEKIGSQEEPGPIVPVEKTFLEKYWWVGAILLLVIGLLLGRMLFRSSRKNSHTQYPNDDFQRQLLERDKIIENNRKQIEKLHADYLALVNSAKENKQGNIPLVSSRHFLTEIMMTAGPRKKPMNEPDSDKDLGEDVCGFVTAADQLLIWLLDGTSDLHCLRNPADKREYFSSRLLAQSIGRKLKSHFSDNNLGTLEAAMTKVLSEVRSDWTRAINNLPESEKNILKSNIQAGNFPECAATVLVGRLSLNGSLDVYRSGDSKMFLFTGGRHFLNTPLADKNDQSNDRVFFRIVVNETGVLDIVHNQPLFESNNYNSIETMIGFSDGIGKATEEQFRSAFVKNPDAVREEITYQLQGTEDDKALFIIEIKK
ncbi:MAG TPA: hypothetical protein VFZ52_01200 [Chryseolinea sp.]